MLPTIQLHPIFIIFAGIAILTGAFVELLTILMIVVIHEVGHYAAATYFSWRIKRLYMWIFGAVMETDEHGVRPLREECIVILAGPLQHVWIYGVAYITQYYELLPPTVVQGIFFYNTVILVFNLLPIWPLDGGKLLYLLLTSIYPYQAGYERTLIASKICCVGIGLFVLLFYSFHIQLFFMLIFLFVEVWREWRKKQFVYMRFLLHRLHEQPYVNSEQVIQTSPHEKIGDILSRFRREKEHFIAIPQYMGIVPSTKNPFHEHICLHYYFYKDGFTHTIADVYDSQFTKPPVRLHIK